MPRPDEGLIHAWLDGELDAVESARVAKLVVTDAEWGAAAAEARGLVAASSRIVKALDAVPAGVIPAGSKAAGALSRRRFVVRGWMRVAATLVLAVGLGYVATRDGTVGPSAGDTRNAAIAPAAADSSAAPSALSSALPSVGSSAGSSASATTTPPPAPSPIRPAATPAESELVAGAARDRAAGGRADDRLRTAGAPASLDSLAARVVESRREVAKTSVAEERPVVVTESIVPSGRQVPVATSSAPATASGAAATLGMSREAAPAAPPPARFAPRQVIERAEPSALADRDAHATTGCWRARTTAPFDTLLLEPRLTPERGDTLRLEVLQRNMSARVVFAGADRLSGIATDSLGRRHSFSATRVSCP